MDRYGETLLGTCAAPTQHGRFPLLLKLIDAETFLSIQVHPDDGHATRNQEADSGKTELWYVIDAAPGGELLCGLHPGVSHEQLRNAVLNDEAATLVNRFAAPPGTAVFVAPGTVHAIGGGLLLAEIQQNSDLTYRLYDWDRKGSDGKPRELHIEKAMEVIRPEAPGGPGQPLSYENGPATCTVLGACHYFAGELWQAPEPVTRNTAGRSFHILLAQKSPLDVQAGGAHCRLAPGQAVLIPAHVPSYTVSGTEGWLDYYVPDLRADVFEPLLARGYDPARIARLGGDLLAGQVTAPA